MQSSWNEGAIKSRFLEALEEGHKNFRCIFQCISTCNPEKSPYCIASALLNAMKGNLEKGFAFSGANAFRVTDIVSVRDLISGLQQEFDQALATAKKEFDQVVDSAKKEMEQVLDTAKKEIDQAVGSAKATLLNT